MRYLSTRGQSPAVDAATALFQGLAPDGGLYLPEQLEPLPAAFFQQLADHDLADNGGRLLAPLLAEVPPPELRRLLAEALNFPLPLVQLEDDLYLLELFHGPTLAFKDVGARFMARLMAWFLRRDEPPLTVLTATSGDTGGAVAQAFEGVPGTRVAVLYPRGRVSPLQERQFATLGGNVQALAVDGSFDDCQRLVKAAFSDPELAGHLRLTSANSINIGRLLPQMLYYLHALAQLPADAPPALFITPSGNFGNLTAGLMARRLGLPCVGFVAATNANDTVPEYLDSGRFRPRPSVATLSSAMDVGNPSNFERILALAGGDLEALRRELHGSRHDDAATREAIREVHRRYGRILDPHTAVGYLGWRQARAEVPGRHTGIILATAHPAKFREHVEPLLGSQLPLPPALARGLQLPLRSLPLDPEPAALRRFLLGWVG